MNARAAIERQPRFLLGSRAGQQWRIDDQAWIKTADSLFDMVGTAFDVTQETAPAQRAFAYLAKVIGKVARGYRRFQRPVVGAIRVVLGQRLLVFFRVTGAEHAERLWSSLYAMTNPTRLPKERIHFDLAPTN